MTKPKILILGAGAAGLGAAFRLHELGHRDFLVLEQNEYPGGLAASFTDPKGFTWDVGGHVQFSHYEYFDRLMDLALGEGWLRHRRESYIWIRGRFVPYPLQNNLRHLPREVMAECVLGLVRASGNHHRPANFGEWLRASFGEGIASHFLLPYNRKVWAHPPEMMSYSWIGERVATVSVEKVLENILLEKDDVRWGPNEMFRFPERGGTGAAWRAVAALLPAGTIRYRTRVASIDAGARQARTEAGEIHPYDYLISTAPLDRLALLVGDAPLVEAASRLRHSTTHIIGVGFRGRPPEKLSTKCWMYFPESDSPFYRVTLFSNYSPHNVPDITTHWSLMAEISESEFKPVDRCRLEADTLEGFYNTGLASPDDEVASTWIRTAEHGYPVPTGDRDEILKLVEPRLESMGILSRGRFGAWKYEVSNQDHSAMQGVEAVDRILLGTPEMTYPAPDAVNNRKGPVPWPR